MDLLSYYHKHNHDLHLRILDMLVRHDYLYIVIDLLISMNLHIDIKYLNLKLHYNLKYYSINDKIHQLVLKHFHNNNQMLKAYDY